LPIECAFQIHSPLLVSKDMLFPAIVLSLAKNFHVPESRGEIEASQKDDPLQHLSFIHEAHID